MNFWRVLIFDSFGCLTETEWFSENFSEISNTFNQNFRFLSNFQTLRKLLNYFHFSENSTQVSKELTIGIEIYFRLSKNSQEYLACKFNSSWFSFYIIRSLSHLVCQNNAFSMIYNFKYILVTSKLDFLLKN